MVVVVIGRTGSGPSQNWTVQDCDNIALSHAGMSTITAWWDGLGRSEEQTMRPFLDSTADEPIDTR